MIDSVAFVWGHAIGTAERRARDQAEPLSPPVYLDFDRLGDRFGRGDGEITTKSFGEGEPAMYGHWKHGALEVMYREGRLEVRTSLPKLLVGHNDVVLDERGTHDALRELVRTTNEILDGCGRNASSPALSLRTADPTRLDYCYQWEVPSVAFALETMKSSFHASRKIRTENISPAGGRTLMYRGGKRVVRFYDKVGEMLARKDDVPADVELDTLLRYEVQDRRRGHLRLVHEDGYRAAAVRRELEVGIKGMEAWAVRDVDAILASYGEFKYAVAFTLRDLYLVEHEEAWPWVRKHTSDSAYYRVKQRVRAAALAVGDLDVHIPGDAFESGDDLWSLEAAAA